MSIVNKHTEIIKDIALKSGFEYCGIAKAQLLNEDARRLESWLNKGMHGTMQYMELQTGTKGTWQCSYRSKND